MFMPGPMSHMMAPYNAAQSQMGANVWMESLMPGHMPMDAWWINNCSRKLQNFAQFHDVAGW